MSGIIYTTNEQIEAMKEELKKASESKSVKAESTNKLIFWTKRVTGMLLSLMILFLLFVLAFVLIAKSKGETPNLLGYQLYVIESGSMEPTLKVGSVIISKIPKDVTALNVGDIVTFKTTKGSTVTHRITEIAHDKDGRVLYSTKGDNIANSTDPEPLSPDQVIAVFVTKVPLT